MSKMRCRCDYIFNLTVSPCPDEYRIIPETTMEESLLARADLTAENMFDRLDEAGRSVLICPNCGRIWLEEAVGNRLYRSYKPEVPVGSAVPDA